MSALRAVSGMAYADFRERTRRTSFLVALTLIAWLAYAVVVGRISLRLEQYQGVVNSAWLGSLIAIVVSSVLGWFGFFLINNAIHLDRSTGTGEVIAATAISRMQYTLAKWLSNFAILSLLMALLMLASIFLHWRYLRHAPLDLFALLMPLAIIDLPLLALVSACAVLFESVRILRGGIGNALWLLGFTTAAAVFGKIATGSLAALDPLGLALLTSSMGAAVKSQFPAYHGGFALTFVSHGELQRFSWAGVTWSAGILIERLLWLVVAVALALLAAGLFDRFDPAARRWRHPPDSTQQQTPTKSAPGRKHEPVSAGVLPAAVRRFSAFYLVSVELRVLLKGARPFWYLVALALAVGGLFTTSPAARAVILLLAWIWPVLIWSAMGCREAREGTSEVVFSCPHPLRMLAAQWLAGVIIAALAGCGVFLRLVSSGDAASLGTWAAAVVFIPSLALMLGVVSGTSKLFEVAYVLLCYVGPLNGIAALDFIGMGGSPSPLMWLGLSVASIAIGLSWRWWQLNH
jgi:hypothetical protein